MTGVAWAAIGVGVVAWTVLATVLVGIPVGRALRRLLGDNNDDGRGE